MKRSNRVTARSYKTESGAVVTEYRIDGRTIPAEAVEAIREGDSHV